MTTGRHGYVHATLARPAPALGRGQLGNHSWASTDGLPMCQQNTPLCRLCILEVYSSIGYVHPSAALCVCGNPAGGPAMSCSLRTQWALSMTHGMDQALTQHCHGGQFDQRCLLLPVSDTALRKFNGNNVERLFGNARACPIMSWAWRPCYAPTQWNASNMPIVLVYALLQSPLPLPHLLQCY